MKYHIFYNGGKGKGSIEASAEHFDDLGSATTRYEELLEQARPIPGPQPERVHGLLLMQTLRDWKEDLGIGIAFTPTAA